MPSEPFWLPVDFVIEANREEVDKTGERHLVRSRDLLESACSKCWTYWSYSREEDLHVLACQILLGIARNHPFEQGNKRTALIAALAFLEVNDVCVSNSSDNSELLARLILSVLGGEIADQVFIERFRDTVTPPVPI